jgi:hypothetical protein
MTTIDPTAPDPNLAHGVAMTGHVILGPEVYEALVAAYVERDALRAEVERLTREVDSTAHFRAGADYARMVKATAEVTALRAAVARMTGPEAVEVARTDLRGLPVIWHNDVLPLAAVLGDENVADVAAAAVRAIAALGAP